MQYRRFGRTELAMPVFSCGGMRYQYSWKDAEQPQITQASQDNIEKIIHRALDVGINHIETARAYGTSEFQLGKILPKFPRDNMIIQTKVEPQSDPAKFRQLFDQSLENLQLDYVDLLGLHGINTPEILHDCVKPGGCLEVARQLQAAGKVRFIGFSTHGTTDLIMQAIATNQFDYVNLHWYYFYQNNWPAVLEAIKHDMGVFIISPSDKGGKLYEPSPKLVELCRPFSPIVFNNLFCLNHPQIHTLSIGAAQPTDFDEHLKSLDALEGAEEILPLIIGRLENELIHTLGADWVNSWSAGLPSWENVPGEINITTILWLYNLAITYDMIEYGKMRYNLLGNASHWFPGKNAADLADYNLSECLANSPHAKKIPEILGKTHQLLGSSSVKRLSQT
jgi:predicted aldo/keto reductase-like oxidoreductase